MQKRCRKPWRAGVGQRIFITDCAILTSFLPDVPFKEPVGLGAFNADVLDSQDHRPSSIVRGLSPFAILKLTFLGPSSII